MNIRKRGNKLGFWFFRTSLKWTGLSGAYGLLYFVCLYYLIFDRTAVSASMAYIQRRFRGINSFQKYHAVYQLFISQGKSLIDRYYVVSGLGRFDIELRGYDRIKSLLSDSKKGLILLTAHVGNWQVTMTTLEKLGRTVYLLMSPEENAAVKDSLNIDSGNEKVKIISPDNFLGGVIEIMKAIDEGSIVSIMGDRSYGHSASEAVLLGDRAYFPHSAFSIAASAQCPVVVLLSAKVSTKKYFVDVSHIMEPRFSSRAKKKEELEGFVQEYAGVLEDYSAEYPYQWFLFHDIWRKENKAVN
ncbi:MAG: lysophospholipid acyltransferase family protein [Nitrospirae bacterium]|nr:lysophospholipid acyltransferase family protein [Nitrospirota bacterium]